MAFLNFIWGLLFDLAVSFASCRREPPRNIASLPAREHNIDRGLRDLVLPAAVGFIWSMLILSVPAALTSIPGASLSDATVSSLMFSCAMLTAPVVGCEMITQGSLFKRLHKRGREMSLLFALGFFASLVFSFSKGASSVVGGEPLSFKNYLLTFIPGAVALVAFEIYKAASRRKKNKKDNK